MFSIKKKFILITPPKTASTCLIDAWQQYGDFERLDQRRKNSFEVKENKNNFNVFEWNTFRELPTYSRSDNCSVRKHACLLSYDSARLKNYHIFASIRNPWERAVSHWQWSLRLNKISFKQWLTQRNWAKKPQIDFIRSDYVPLNAIHFIRYENLQNDFNKACDIIGVPRRKLKVRSDNNKPYYDYYTLETRKMVSDIYKKDIDLFGYEFRPPGI